MGRKVAEATKACRMRRTRGDITRLRRRVEVLCAVEVRGFFFAVVLLLPVDAFGDDEL